MRRVLGAMCVVVVAMGGCAQSTPRSWEMVEGQAPADAESGVSESAWSPDFRPPVEWVSPRLRLEPLGPEHNAMDFAAAQGSREHLQRTLQWGGWPSADATPEENLSDLERHAGEFERREAYAYTVLSPDWGRCLGCVYINPVGAKGAPEFPDRARVAFWVIEPEVGNDLDRELVSETLAMIESAYPIDRVDFSIPVQNERGASVLASLGLEEIDPAPNGNRVFVWRRAGG
ncbi:MAG: GNAT family N-acetyltransferase [Phycisphaerales bacterium]